MSGRSVQVAALLSSYVKKTNDKPQRIQQLVANSKIRIDECKCVLLNAPRRELNLNYD